MKWSAAVIFEWLNDDAGRGIGDGTRYNFSFDGDELLVELRGLIVSFAIRTRVGRSK